MMTGFTLGLFANWHHILIYCFLSLAYSVAIGVTMIILLLIHGDVSNSLQGGFVAVVIIGGCIVGGCGFFKPVACEPFGCLLGGFCFGMWMLTLVQSGLLAQDATKNGLFLSGMSILTVLLYFWRFTKHYTMTASSAFVGATALVLGIDFVSNAGLKEYWVWIWNLNEDLFPPDADTYPLKIGIKVEQGVTVVFFLVGIASQWSRTRTIKQQQAKLELENRAGHIAAQKADEKAGLEFQKRIAPEREAFEARLIDPPGATYQGRGSRMDKFLTPLQKGWVSLRDIGVKKDDEPQDAEITPEEACDVARADLKDRGIDPTSAGCEPVPDTNDQSRMSVQTKHDSCHSLTKDRASGATITRITTGPDEIRPASPRPTVTEERNIESDETRPASPPRSTTPGKQDIEMDNIRPATPIKPTAAEMVMGKDEEAGRVTVHVAVDEVELAAAAAAAARAAANPAPEVTPLPFRAATPLQPTAAAVVMAQDDEAGRVTIHVAVDEVEFAAAARAAANPVPEVIPLPFRLPTAEDEEEEKSDDDDDHSSLAVMADDFPDKEKEVHETQSTHSKRDNFAKRLSTSSVEIFRRLSQRSMSTHMAKGSMKDSESTEDLNAPRHGDRDSVAATLDDMSSVDENDLPAATSVTSENRFSKEINAELADLDSDIRVEITQEVGEEAVGKKSSGGQSTPTAALSASVVDVKDEGDVVGDKFGTGPSEPSTKEEDKHSDNAVSERSVGSGAGMSQVFVNSAVPQTLETGKLETRVNQAVQTYRMVDWVKHQTKADEPQIDNLDIPELRDLTPARPVDVEDLVKTAEDGAPRIAKPRTASAIHTWARTSSAQHQHAAHQPTRLSPHHHGHDRTSYVVSEQIRQAEIQATAAALAGATVLQASSFPSQATTTAESLRARPPVPGIKSFNTPQSLVAKRETMIRMKEQALRPHSVRPAPTAASSAAQDYFGEVQHAYGSVPALGPPSLTSDPTSVPSSRRTSGAYRSPNVSNALFSELDEADDDSMPMRQRQAIIRSRRSSLTSTPSSGNEASGSSSEGGSRGGAGMPAPTPPTADNNNNNIPGYGYSNSASSLAVHDPRRPPHSQRNASDPHQGQHSRSSLAAHHNPNVPHLQRTSFDPLSSHKREAQLAGFRSSVQADLRASSQALPVMPQSGYGGGYRSNNNLTAPMMNSPLIDSVYHTIPGTSSSHSLQTPAWQSEEVSRGLELHRQSMMTQKERGEDDRRREARRAERLRQSQLREASKEGMLDKHSESMWKLQKKANIQ